MTTSYCIRIKGHLDNRWSDWFDGLSIRHLSDGTTELVGEIADQAALHGVIARVRDLGLPLISLEQHCRTGRGDREGGATSKDTR